MKTFIDLSQDIFSGMPVHKEMPPVSVRMHRSHEQWAGIRNPSSHTPAVLKLEMGEHSGSHVDALSHMGKEFHASSIDRMPLSMFHTRAICLDLSAKGHRELIGPEDLAKACRISNSRIRKGDTVLLYTDHYRKCYLTENWDKGPGISVEAAKWLGKKGIAAFGVETLSPGVPGISNSEVHRVCGEMGFTHYENLINLHLLVGKGRFLFIGFPLKIRGGTGSPVRAVAILD